LHAGEPPAAAASEPATSYARGWSPAVDATPIRHQAFFMRDASGAEHEISAGEALGLMLAAALARGASS
jgi:hypothetical protein